MHNIAATITVLALLGSVSLTACGGADDDDPGSPGTAGSSAGGDGSAGNSNGGKSSGGNDGSSAGKSGAGEPAGGSSDSAGSAGTTGSAGDAGETGASGAAGRGSDDAGGWCSIFSAPCVSELANCPELNACQADQACASAVAEAFACICGGERLGSNDGGAGACAATHLGATGTLSGDVAACFGKNKPAVPLCLASVAVGCNELDLTDPIVPERALAQAAPTPLGEAIPPGTYVLTDWIDYTGAGGQTGPKSDAWRETLSIQGGTMQDVSMKFDNGLTSVKRGARETRTFAVEGHSLTTTTTCRNGATDSPSTTIYSFDATATGLTLFSQSGLHAQVYLKQ